MQSIFRSSSPESLDLLHTVFDIVIAYRKPLATATELFRAVFLICGSTNTQALTFASNSLEKSLRLY